MLFVELVHDIHPHLMKDADVPTFMRNLIQMLCDIPEEDWATTKDPSSKESNKDASLRKFYTNGPTKKLAKAMLGRLTEENFIDSIHYGRSDVVLEMLAEDLEPYDDSVNKDNVGQVLFNLFKQALNMIVKPELENERRLRKAEQKSAQAKNSFGQALLADCGHSCSKPGCGKLFQSDSDEIIPLDDYEVVQLGENKKVTYESSLSLCHDCFKKYTYKHTKAQEKELITVKKMQMQYRSSQSVLDELSIEKGIVKVVEALSRAKAKDLETLNYDAVSVSEKIDENGHVFLFNQVNMNVLRYFRFVERCMQEAVMKNYFDEEILRSQIRATYKKLVAKKMRQEIIYEFMAQNLKKITKQEIIYCYILVCYFIQSCEVFDAVTK